MKKDIFVPPGVQVRLADRLGDIPRQLPAGAASKIEALWAKRNTAPDDQLDGIDASMETIVVSSVLADRARQPHVIFERHDLHGTGARRHKVFVMPARKMSRRFPEDNSPDYWACVTDVPCPCCRKGKIRWHEAGYVKGYRICDACERTFLAKGTADMPKLVLDI